MIKQYSYGYDLASNRTSETVATMTTTSTPNNVNEITSQSGGVTRTLTYDLNGSITSDGGTRTFEWDAANRLVAINYVATGERTEMTYDGLGRRVRITEKNPGTTLIVQPPNTQYSAYSSGSFFLAAGTYTLKFQGLNPNGGDNTAFVDSVSLNGTLVPNGGFEAPNFGWGSYAYAPAGGTWIFGSGTGISDNGSPFTSSNPSAPEGTQVGLVQREDSMSQSITLTAGNYTLSLFAAQRGNYNASYQKLLVTLESTVPVISPKNFVWAGQQILEERDAANVVTKRFYAQGEEINGTAYFYTRDHLGSIREMFTGGTVVARYDYDPYGRSTTVLETIPTDFNFTGLYRHSKSSLNLALYRAYDADLGRWLNRDPMTEEGGLNLYRYVKNNPINLWDPLGLTDFTPAQTQALLGQAYQDATAGRIRGLLNIFSNSTGRFDFKVNQSNDTFNVNGRVFSPAEFGNFIAGFAARAYDKTFSPFGAPIALSLVGDAGIYYHVTDYDALLTGDYDPLDLTGIPYIGSGAEFVDRFPKCR